MSKEIEQPAINPIEDQRVQALKHYEEASSAIHHWSSFVESAIKAYNPQPQPPSLLREVIGEMESEANLLTGTEDKSERKKKKVKRRVVVLTEAEHTALFLMIENGWGNGDFEGYGGQKKSIQHKARQKFFTAPMEGIALH